MRVLVVDDSAVMRRAISSMIATDSALEVVDTARDGKDALEKIERLRPDVVTLDIEMPVLDGLGVLEKLRALSDPRPAVLVCSTLTTAGSQMALKAMRLGAVDFITKDPNSVGSGAEHLRTELIAKVKAVAPRSRSAALKTCPVANPSPLAPKAIRDIDLSSHPTDMLVIGSSTGGPPVLEGILSALPATLHCPVIVAQHMPAMFTRSMTERLREVCSIKLVHADKDALLEPGTGYICEGGKHVRVHRMSGLSRYRIEVSTKPESALYKPSVTELFLSCANAAKERAVGVMLTGMGDDGKPGAIAMHKAGARVIAQLGETCAVYGMPKAVVDSGAASAILDPARIAQALLAIKPCGDTRQAA